MRAEADTTVSLRTAPAHRRFRSVPQNPDGVQPPSNDVEHDERRPSSEHLQSVDSNHEADPGNAASFNAVAETLLARRRRQKCRSCPRPSKKTKSADQNPKVPRTDEITDVPLRATATASPSLPPTQPIRRQYYRCSNICVMRRARRIG